MSTIVDRQLMSLYVTLLLSVGCLGYAELGQDLPETPFFYVGMFLALGLAYWLEGRFTLSSMVSNALALMMLLAGFAWLIINSPSPTAAADYDFSLIRTLVTRSGPILCALLLAKLFRPKTASDQWLLQLLGLVQVILACVMAMSSRMDRDAPLFPVLMVLYLASLAWAFRLFYLRHETCHLTTSGHTAENGLVSWFSFKPLGWFLASLVLTVTIFFCLPQGGLDANLFQGFDHTETGVTSNIDLNAEGAIQVSDQKVMRIWAKDRKGPVMLPESMRLRGAILSVYNDNTGKWLPFPSSSYVAQRVPTVPEDVKENHIRMDFDMDVQQLQELGRPRASRYSADINIPLYLANPPQLSNSFARNFTLPATGTNPTPINANLFEGQFWLTMNRTTQTVILTHDFSGKFETQEWQQQMRDLPQEFHNYRMVMEKVPRRVESSGRIAELSQSFLQLEKLTAKSTDREKAKALEKHLSMLPYKYSLERRRMNTSIDPTEDFLFNVQEGHCERFASALAIMLRTVGIPARIVIGYRGVEWNELGGFHLVRQLHAHAWVEALVEVQRQNDGTTTLHWMTLDATPLNDSPSGESSYYSPLTFARFLWEFFILDFAGQAQRTRLFAQLQNSWIGKLIVWWSKLSLWQSLALSLACLTVFVGLIWLLVRWRRRVRQRRFQPATASTITIPFYAQLLQLLARRGWKPGVSETPAEFAQTVEQKLLKAEQPAAIAELPATLVPPYYAVRYGAATLASADQAQLDIHLQTLRTALQR